MCFRVTFFSLALRRFLSFTRTDTLFITRRSFVEPSAIQQENHDIYNENRVPLPSHDKWTIWCCRRRKQYLSLSFVEKFMFKQRYFRVKQRRNDEKKNARREEMHLSNENIFWRVNEKIGHMEVITITKGKKLVFVCQTAQFTSSGFNFKPPHSHGMGQRKHTKTCHFNTLQIGKFAQRKSRIRHTHTQAREMHSVKSRDLICSQLALLKLRLSHVLFIRVVRIAQRQLPHDDVRFCVMTHHTLHLRWLNEEFSVSSIKKKCCWLLACFFSVLSLIETRYTLFIIEILEVDEMVSMLPPTQKFQELPVAIGKVVYDTRLCLGFYDLCCVILTNNF